MVRALALRSGDPGFKTRSDHFVESVPGSTSQLHWFASGQLGFLLVVVVFCCFVNCLSLALKSPRGEWSIKYVLITGMALGFFNLGPGTRMFGQIGVPKHFLGVPKSW